MNLKARGFIEFTSLTLPLQARDMYIRRTSSNVDLAKTSLIRFFGKRKTDEGFCFSNLKILFHQRRKQNIKLCLRFQKEDFQSKLFLFNITKIFLFFEKLLSLH